VTPSEISGATRRPAQPAHCPPRRVHHNGYAPATSGRRLRGLAPRLGRGQPPGRGDKPAGQASSASTRVTDVSSGTAPANAAREPELRPRVAKPGPRNLVRTARRADPWPAQSLVGGAHGFGGFCPVATFSLVGRHVRGRKGSAPPRWRRRTRGPVWCRNSPPRGDAVVGEAATFHVQGSDSEQLRSGPATVCRLAARPAQRSAARRRPACRSAGASARHCPGPLA